LLIEEEVKRTDAVRSRELATLVERPSKPGVTVSVQKFRYSGRYSPKQGSLRDCAYFLSKPIAEKQLCITLLALGILP
jgi:hypothetical protein